MKLLFGFVRFWYDFIVGDAWEVAAGVLATLAVSWGLAQAGLSQIAWPVLVLGMAAALGVSLVWQARANPRSQR